MWLPILSVWLDRPERAANKGNARDKNYRNWLAGSSCTRAAILA
jgi:hypothetical protein